MGKKKNENDINSHEIIAFSFAREERNDREEKKECLMWGKSGNIHNYYYFLFFSLCLYLVM